MDDGKLHGDFHERLFEIFLGGDVAPDHPLFVAFTPERGRKSEKTEFVRKDANDAGPTAHRHVIVLDAVGGGESTAPILFAPRIHTGRIGRGFFEPLGERRMMRTDLENQEREPRVGLGPRRTAPHVPQIVDHPFAHGGRRDFRERVPQLVRLAARLWFAAERAFAPRPQARIERLRDRGDGRRRRTRAASDLREAHARNDECWSASTSAGGSKTTQNVWKSCSLWTQRSLQLLHHQ